MRHPLRLSMALLSLAVASPVFAQGVSQNGSSNASVDSAVVAADTSSQIQSAVAPVGASVTGLRAGVHSRETARPNQPTMAAVSQHMGQDRAMMVVGVAGLIAGAIIGGTPGTIVMVGGAVVGLLGLYNYLQ